ncbi:MAG: hypothetical protein ACR2PL_18230 [Dehalococcoidia bacterium]
MQNWRDAFDQWAGMWSGFSAPLSSRTGADGGSGPGNSLQLWTRMLQQWPGAWQDLTQQSAPPSYSEAVSFWLESINQVIDSWITALRQTPQVGPALAFPVQIWTQLLDASIRAWTAYIEQTLRSSVPATRVSSR